MYHQGAEVGVGRYPIRNQGRNCEYNVVPVDKINIYKNGQIQFRQFFLLQLFTAENKTDSTTKWETKYFHLIGLCVANQVRNNFIKRMY